MSEKTQNSPQYIRYKDIVLQKAKEYYEKNKEKRKEYARNRYQNRSQEQKNKLVEYRKAWINKQDEDKRNEMKKRARKYAKNRYHNDIVAVK